jgi:hypothetical protein
MIFRFEIDRVNTFIDDQRAFDYYLTDIENALLF